MSNPAKRKGSKAERAFRRICEDLGLEATPVAASGAYAGGGHGDVRVEGELKVEVKSRKTLPKVQEGWLGPCDVLVIRGDGGPGVKPEWRIYMDAGTALRWYRAWRAMRQVGEDA